MGKEKGLTGQRQHEGDDSVAGGRAGFEGMMQESRWAWCVGELESALTRHNSDASKTSKSMTQRLTRGEC